MCFSLFKLSTALKKRLEHCLLENAAQVTQFYYHVLDSHKMLQFNYFFIENEWRVEYYFKKVKNLQKYIRKLFRGTIRDDFSYIYDTHEMNENLIRSEI